MKWVLLAVGAIIFLPLIIKVLWWLFTHILNILSWLLWPIAVLLVIGGIIFLVDGRIVGGILLILLGALVTAPIGVIRKKEDEEAWWEDQDYD